MTNSMNSNDSAKQISLSATISKGRAAGTRTRQRDASSIENSVSRKILIRSAIKHSSMSGSDSNSNACHLGGKLWQNSIWLRNRNSEENSAAVKIQTLSRAANVLIQASTCVLLVRSATSLHQRAFVRERARFVRFWRHFAFADRSEFEILEERRATRIKGALTDEASAQTVCITTAQARMPIARQRLKQQQQFVSPSPHPAR